MAAASSSPTMASTPARCSTTSATATSHTRCDIPSCAPTASMGSGRTDERRSTAGVAKRWDDPSRIYYTAGNSPHLTTPTQGGLLDSENEFWPLLQKPG